MEGELFTTVSLSPSHKGILTRILEEQYVRDNVPLEFYTLFMGTRGVVERLIQHEAQLSAVWVWRHNPSSHKSCVER